VTCQKVLLDPFTFDEASSPSLQCCEADPSFRRPYFQKASEPPLSELIDGKEEHIVEKILNSRMFQQRLQYLIKWEGYRTKHNIWKYSEKINNAPEKIADFYTKNPAAPCHIHAMTFSTISFCSISLTFTLSFCFCFHHLFHFCHSL